MHPNQAVIAITALQSLLEPCASQDCILRPIPLVDTLSERLVARPNRNMAPRPPEVCDGRHRAGLVFWWMLSMNRAAAALVARSPSQEAAG